MQYQSDFYSVNPRLQILGCMDNLHIPYNHANINVVQRQLQVAVDRKKNGQFGMVLSSRG